jgi:hypothetical protein
VRIVVSPIVERGARLVRKIHASTNYTRNGTSGVTYYFKVAAANAGGTSAFTGPASAKAK